MAVKNEKDGKRDVFHEFCSPIVDLKLRDFSHELEPSTS
jgi:hypothetical protein